jgi:hydantoinase/carbamoylase family amidase
LSSADQNLANDHQALEADPGRIARFLRELGEIGRDPLGGWSRLAFSPEEREAHELFRRWATELGMKVHTDSIGNTFAELEGESSGPVILVGSHLDTVPQGGNFDGAAGVAIALEIAHLLSKSGGLRLPYRAVVFSCEEGARFGAPCIGSRVATGAFTTDTLRELSDSEGRTVVECASEVGLNPVGVAEAVWPPGSVAAFLELHIEQGRVLESRGLPVGIVDAIAGSTRLRLTFRGHADHSGATPMLLRNDALAGASEFVVEVEQRAAALRTTVATVGQMEVRPGAFTTVPGLVRLSLDVRDIDSENQRDLADDLLDRAMRIAARRGLELSATLVSDQSPVVLHQPVRERLAHAAQRAGVPFRVLPSGASHDAAHVAKVAPAGMVFIPSREGISHSPEEWSDAEDIAKAATVMIMALQSLDRHYGGAEESLR